MVEKIPPHNTEAEKSVLGSAMLSKDALALKREGYRHG